MTATYGRVARKNLLAILTAFGKPLNMRPEAVCRQYYGSSEFFVPFFRGDRTIGMDNFDRMVDAIKLDWPKGAIWPKTVPAHIKPPRSANGRRGYRIRANSAGQTDTTTSGDDRPGNRTASDEGR